MRTTRTYTKKNACRRGHPYSWDNVRMELVITDGRRYLVRRCKTCQSDRVNEYQKRKRRERNHEAHRD